MKIHFLLFAIIFCSSCNFFDQEDPRKKKAKTLLADITTLQAELEPRIEEISKYGKTKPGEGASEEEKELSEVGFKVLVTYDAWKRMLEIFHKREVYMNKDLTVIQLEKLKRDLDNLAYLVEKGESFSK